MKSINVTKMNGLGNDFVLLSKDEFDKANLTFKDFAIKICDRHFGIGADGVIIPKKSDICDIGWYFYQSDGSTAQMCGNGMRVFSKYIFDKGLINKKTFSVETGAGIIQPSIQENGQIKVNMGKPILIPEKIPCKFNKCFGEELIIKDKKFKINLVSMGNPHCIIFLEENQLDYDIKELAKNYGPFIELDKNFPEKTNVEFAKIKSKNEIDLSVWERGCGITLACGTGACATVVAAIINKLTDNKVKVNLPGGSLLIEWDGNKENTNNDIFMTGPANYNFEAKFYV